MDSFYSHETVANGSANNLHTDFEESLHTQIKNEEEFDTGQKEIYGSSITVRLSMDASNVISRNLLVQLRYHINLPPDYCKTNFYLKAAKQVSVKADDPTSLIRAELHSLEEELKLHIKAVYSTLAATAIESLRKNTFDKANISYSIKNI